MQNENHSCRLCGAFFIPFKEDIECPHCGVRATDEAVEKYAQFIPELVATAKLNKLRYGQYIPPQWPVGLMVKDVQLFMFELLDMLETKKPKNKKTFFKKTILDAMGEHGQELAAHLGDIAREVLAGLHAHKRGIKKK